MASNVDVANSALTKLGADRIMSLDDDIKPAREIKAVFDIRRDYLLRAYNWNFSIKRALLTALTSEPEWGYTLEYQLPSDCLRVLQVNDTWNIPGYSDFIGGPDEEPYKIESTKIRSDIAAPLKLRYVSRITNAGLFDAMFIEVLAIDLAYQCCEAITQSNTKKDGLRGDKTEALMMAVRANAIELPPQYMADDSWLAAKMEG